MALLTPDVQAIVRKPERDRTPAEQKIFDDYFPVIRIDPSKIKEIMPKEEVAQVQRAAQAASRARRSCRRCPPTGPWKRTRTLLKEKSYILTTGDPKRPELDKPVEPGFPFQPAGIDFRDGRREAFTDWLTDAQNPLFARVAVNRIWAWHFGEGLQRVTSDFGLLGGKPTNQKLLDYLASEFVAHDYSMKWLHRLIVTSDTYQLSSQGGPQVSGSQHQSGRAQYLSVAFPAAAAGSGADLGCHSLRLGRPGPLGGRQVVPALDAGQEAGDLLARRRRTRHADNRRGIYLVRGYIPSTDVMNNFLTSFDVDDGRTPCPIRTQTVTAPQALFTMNNELIEKESAKLADRVLQESGGDLRAAVELAYPHHAGARAVGIGNGSGADLHRRGSAAA